MTTHRTAQGLASLGRHGDSMLVHMSPHEVAGLNYLAKKQGTKLTINPDTGLPEAFRLGGLFSSLLPMFAGAIFPGAPLIAGALTGAGVAAVKKEDPLLGGLMGGLGGMGGADLFKGLSGATSNVAAGGSTPYSLAGGYVDPSTINAMVGPQVPGAGLANTGLQSSQSMMTNPVIRNAVQATQQAGGILPNTGSFMDKELTALANAKTGAGNLISGKPGAWEGFKNAFIDPKTGTGALTNTEAAMKIGMPIGGAVLGGLEPSDLYGEPLKGNGKDKYDPYATLNLSGDTGLRLYAMGGTVASGGLRDLYSGYDTQNTLPLSRDEYGVGRLDNLARQQSMNQAQITGYADGGVVSPKDTGLNLDLSSKLNLNTGLNNSSSFPLDRLTGGPGSFLRALISKGNFKFTPSNKPDLGIASLTGPTGPGYTEPLYPTGPDYAATELTDQDTYALAKPKFAQGGPVSFADGGATDPLNMSLSPIDQNLSETNLGGNFLSPSSFMSQNAPGQNASVQNTANTLSGVEQNNGSIVSQVANNLKTDPNYQPKNPIEASIVNQLKGTNQLQQPQQAQGLGSLGAQGPSQPMMPSYNPTQAMGPTYFAGMNAPRGMARGGYLNGVGDGMSDSIPATIEGKQPARLADGEFVVPADVVSHLGNGSSKAGSQRLYSMLDKVRKARTGHTKQGKQIKPEKYMPA